MHTPSLTRPARLLATVLIALCSFGVYADFSSVPVTENSVVLAQAVDGATPDAPPVIEQAPATPVKENTVPDLAPGVNKKRVAFWGVTFMLATSLAFIAFGTWAIRKTPKPGQQRPD